MYRSLGHGGSLKQRRSSGRNFESLGLAREFTGLTLTKTSVLKACFTAFPGTGHAQPLRRIPAPREIKLLPINELDQKLGPRNRPSSIADEFFTVGKAKRLLTLCSRPDFPSLRFMYSQSR